MSITQQSLPHAALTGGTRPRLAFLGVGWIGQHRLRSIAEADIAEVHCIADTHDAAARDAATSVGSTNIATTLDEVLDTEPDGLIIATPNALHAEQAVAALDRGIAVFCQKPLARTREETQRVINAARRADRLLAVDFSYRFMEPARQVRELIHSGALGDVFQIDLTFHNGFGPDKAWFFDPALAGGGCLMDLGIHFLDLAMWWLNKSTVSDSHSALYRDGALVTHADEVVEDFATASLCIAEHTTLRLACSWNASLGCDAVISATVHGTNGGATINNVNGSFFDFQAYRHTGRTSELLHEPPDGWFGKAVVDWAARLAAGERYDADVETTLAVADALDRLYGRTR